VSRLAKLLIAAIACCALLGAGSAGAATVVNGGFETGNFEGWQVLHTTEAGNWFVYSGDETPIAKAEREEEEKELEECEEEEDPPPCPLLEDHKFFPPPSGNFAAATDEEFVSSLVLYQDVALEPYFSHQLAMTLYYKSDAPILVPNPDTLEVNFGPDENQQLRVDVIRPDGPLFSLSPSDILATVFANKSGDPTTMAPTGFTADLSAFAGQTVRIRIANAVHDDLFNAGVDDVAIASTPPSNVIKKGKLKLNKKKGTAKLKVTVPGPGVLSTALKKKVKKTTVNATAAGTVTLPLKAIGKGLKTLNKNGKLKLKLPVTFTPTGGTAGTQKFGLTLKKSLKPKETAKKTGGA